MLRCDKKKVRFRPELTRVPKAKKRLIPKTLSEKRQFPGREYGGKKFKQFYRPKRAKVTRSPSRLTLLQSSYQTPLRPQRRAKRMYTKDEDGMAKRSEVTSAL